MKSPMKLCNTKITQEKNEKIILLLCIIFQKTIITVFSVSIVKTEQFLDERKNCSPKKQIKCESSKESQQLSKSSAHKRGETSPIASSKLTLLKTKEESSKETEPASLKRKEYAVELKGEGKSPKKIKSSPAKKEVEFSKSISCWGCVLI